MTFLTKEKFKEHVNEYQKRFPKVQHWTENRWIYHEMAVNILKESMKKGDKILEIGPAGVKLVEGQRIYTMRRKFPGLYQTYNTTS